MEFQKKIPTTDVIARGDLPVDGLLNMSVKNKNQNTLRDTSASQMGDALRDPEQWANLVIRNLPDIILTVDRNGKILALNHSVITPIEKVIGRSIYSFATQESREVVRKALKRVFQAGEISSCEILATGRAGPESAWYESRFIPLKSNNHIVAATVIAVDITQRKTGEERLRQSEQMYKTLVETLPDAVTVTDLKGNITYLSQRTVELHGFNSAEEVLGKSAFELIAPKDHKRAMENLKKTLKKGSVKNLVYTLLRKGGTGFIGEMHASLIKDSYGKPKAFIAATRDVTERQDAEKRLKESESRLLEQKEALEQKTAALSEIIKQIEVEKSKIKEDIAININDMLLPILEKLKIKKVSRKYIQLLQNHLKELGSSFGRKISEKSMRLSSREIEICSMIKGGLTSKEIAELLNISHQTVEKHRKNIRNKLGISNKDINLASFLFGLK